MRLYDILNEGPQDETDHAKALRTTGFWGKRGAGALIAAQDTGRFLIALRSAQVEQPHTYGTFGGAIDSGEDFLTAAKRELSEELGLNGPFVGAKELFKFEAKDKSTGEVTFTYQNFVFVVPKEIPVENFKLNWETDEVQWFTLRELAAIPNLHFGMKAVLNDPASASTLKALAK